MVEHPNPRKKEHPTMPLLPSNLPQLTRVVSAVFLSYKRDTSQSISQLFESLHKVLPVRMAGRYFALLTAKAGTVHVAGPRHCTKPASCKLPEET